MKLRIMLFMAVFAFMSAAQAQRVIRKGQVVKPNTSQPSAVTAWYKIGNLKGNWKETRRYENVNDPVAYTDTILLKINGNKSLTKTMGTMALDIKGSAAIEAPNVLLIAADRYEIDSANAGTLILSNTDGKHVFTKVAELPRGAAAPYEGPSALAALSKIDVAKAIGEWEVYRREAAPGFITDKTTLIKNFKIVTVGKESDGGFINIYNGENILQKIPCTFIFDNGKMHFMMTAANLEYEVYELSDNAFVFGKKGDLVNYARRKN